MMMNETIVTEASKAETILVELLNKTVNAVESGAEWIAGEIPEVVTQLLTWHFVQAVVIACLTGLVIAATLFYTLRVFREMRKPDHEADGTKIISWIFASLTSVFICFPFFIANLLTALKIWVAPKLYLLTYAADLVR